MDAVTRPPGPRGHPVLGSLPEFGRDALGFLTGCARTHGDVSCYRIGAVHVYLLNHPDYVEQVLVKESENFSKGRLLRASREVLGDGLLIAEGDTWRRHRQIIQPAFGREPVAGYGTAISAEIERALAAWGPGQVRDLAAELRELALRIAARTMFGTDLAGEAGAATAAIAVVRQQFAARMGPGWLIPQALPTPGRLRLRRAVRQLESIVYAIIRRRRASGERPHDLLSLLLDARDAAGLGLSQTEIRDEVMNFLIVGHETTAQALAWTVYLLARHRDAAERVRAEARAVLGGRTPAAGDLARLIDTRRVIDEALRLYPPAWTIPRVALQEFSVGDYRVPAGASVVVSPWVLQRDPRFFPRPDAFEPERWGDAASRAVPRFAYFPFGAGARGCIGRGLALLEAVSIVAAIMQRFALTWAAEGDLTPWPTFTLQPRGAFKVRLE